MTLVMKEETYKIIMDSLEAIEFGTLVIPAVTDDPDVLERVARYGRQAHGVRNLMFMAAKVEDEELEVVV